MLNYLYENYIPQINFARNAEEDIKNLQIIAQDQ